MLNKLGLHSDVQGGLHSCDETTCVLLLGMTHMLCSSLHPLHAGQVTTRPHTAIVGCLSQFRAMMGAIPGQSADEPGHLYLTSRSAKSARQTSVNSQHAENSESQKQI